MKKLFSLSLILLFLMSCNKDDDGYRELDMAMVKLNIADAEMLALCGNETKTKSDQQGSDLFKIDKNGKMSAVYWVMPGTTDTLGIIPSLILPLSEEYVLFSGVEVSCSNPDSYYYMKYGDSYVIRKKDGAIFKIDREKCPVFEYSHENDIDFNPRTDKQNNVYCLASDYENYGNYEDYGVYKFALGNLSDITMQKVNLDQFPVDSRYDTHPFEVDFKGNCITYVKNERVILYKAEGGLYEFPQEENVFNYFVGYNGDLYCCSYPNEKDYSSNKQYKIYPLEVGVQVLYDFDNAVSKTTQTSYSGSKSRIYTLENKYIHVLLATDDTNNMLVYNSKDETIKEVGFTPGTLEDVVGVSNNSIYRIMDNKIFKYDFVSDQKSITPIDFDFSSCSVYKKWSAYNVPNGSKFILGAIRNSDMAKLRIEVDMESGKATVFEDMQDRPIVTLVQIR